MGALFEGVKLRHAWLQDLPAAGLLWPLRSLFEARLGKDELPYLLL